MTDHLYDPVGDVIRRDVRRLLLVNLTDSERLQIAENKAALESEIVGMEHELADLIRDKRQQIKDAERRVVEMGAELRDRQQRRAVACYERWAEGRIEVVRTDLDPRDPTSVIDRRSATPDEAQRELPANVVKLETGKRKRG